jgi:hypothetical protein
MGKLCVINHTSLKNSRECAENWQNLKHSVGGVKFLLGFICIGKC